MLTSSDTHPKAAALLLERLREAGPGGRAAMALALSEGVRELALAGAKLRAEKDPGRDPEAEVRRLYLGEELACRVEAWRRRG